MASIIKTTESEKDSHLLRVFCPNVRAISHDDIKDLFSPNEVNAIEGGDEGVWLEVPCPAEQCLRGENMITLPARGAGRGRSKDLWLKVFCPQDNCLFTEATDLP